MIDGSPHDQGPSGEKSTGDPLHTSGEAGKKPVYEQKTLPQALGNDPALKNDARITELLGRAQGKLYQLSATVHEPIYAATLREEMSRIVNERQRSASGHEF